MSRKFEHCYDSDDCFGDHASCWCDCNRCTETITEYNKRLKLKELLELESRLHNEN